MMKNYYKKDKKTQNLHNLQKDQLYYNKNQSYIEMKIKKMNFKEEKKKD